MCICIYKCVIIILINFVIATISFVLSIAGDLPDLQAPPQPCSNKNKTDSDNIDVNRIIMTTRINLIQSDINNNNKNNNDNNNYIIIKIAIIIVITVRTI